MKTGSTWDVVATVKAPVEYVIKFVDVYRKLGASHIHLFYDDPAQSHAITGLDLTETVCNMPYWNGKRPRALEKRQMANATVAARSSTSDWIIHCDIDEHLHSKQSISQTLAEVPENCSCLIILPVEAVFSSRPASTADIFDTSYFKTIRAGWKPSVAFWSEIYGDMVKLSAAGFWGHRVGKSFIRRRNLSDLHSMPIHMPSGPPLTKMNPMKSKKITLRHYDALLPAEWHRKHLERITREVLAIWAGDRRNEQSRLVADTLREDGLGRALELYDSMYVLTPSQIEVAVKAGTVCVIPPRI